MNKLLEYNRTQGILIEQVIDYSKQKYRLIEKIIDGKIKIYENGRPNSQSNLEQQLEVHGIPLEIHNSLKTREITQDNLDYLKSFVHPSQSTLNRLKEENRNLFVLYLLQSFR